ncbi:MAG TPA: DEAD/DEAH box helicase [Gemmatimonadales bacterium]|nr:DEAD/DEAH box helicase [Gemmatimonadales bacterium]
MLYRRSSRILSEHLAPLPEPLACLLRAGEEVTPGAVTALGARALLDLAAVAGTAQTWPSWLAPHQVPAAARLRAIIGRYGGALLADAVGLGKSYVALAVALAFGQPLVLVVPAVLVDQWRGLLRAQSVEAQIVTHESLSASEYRPSPPPTAPYRRLFIVDEAHRFRHPETRRYRALAKLVVGARVILVTATPVHNRIADLFNLFRLFLRDHDLTALGVPSLSRAARGELAADAVAAVAARLTVARSRRQVLAGYPAGPLGLAFPERGAGEIIRAGPTGEETLVQLIAGVRSLAAGGDAAGLLRLLLLTQLASSLAAFRASLGRYDAFLDLARAAAAEGRALSHGDFQRLFPPAETGDLQLALFPVLLPQGAEPAGVRDRDATHWLLELSKPVRDPKADALERLLGENPGKTIVFVRPRATVRYLLRRLRALRVAAVMGDAGLFGAGRAAPVDVLRAFAPRAQGASPPSAALETDVLIATDLLSEGLNLQDAARVIHYDTPWSPARLAQRVGRIDRMGSAHARIETVAFLPPPALDAALLLEWRLATKTQTQIAAGAAQVEAPAGRAETSGPLDWCDRLQRLLSVAAPAGRDGAVAAVAGEADVVVLIVRIGSLVEALAVTGSEARPDPDHVTQVFEHAASAAPQPVDRARLGKAVRIAAPLVRARLTALEAARWRAEDRDRMGRRLVPWVLAAARRAARRGNARELSRLDALVSRLALGMTAGEEVLLEELLERRKSLPIGDVLAWHERLPPVSEGAEAPLVELVAALLVTPP